MQNNTLSSVSLYLFLFLSANFIASAQSFLKEIPLEIQVSESSQIVEGKVISKHSYWNADHTNIYTVNTLKVYKVFKGEILSKIHIITPGGTVGNNSEVVTPSLKLFIEDIGVFMLNKKNVVLDSNNEDASFYDVYSSLQGAYRYNLQTNIAANTFRKTQDIENNFYKTITNLTGNGYTNISEFKPQQEFLRLLEQTESLAITDISPSTISAGTESILTINGTGFTNTRFRVGFPNADDGGSTYINAYDPQVISWSNTQILVEVPSFAGTGPVRVTTTTGTQFFSDILTIEYAHINLVPDDETPAMEYPTQLISDDGSGGYNFLYNTEFNANEPARNSFRRAFDSWICQSGVNWKIGGVNGTDITQFDGINLIRFDNGAELPNGVLARNTSYYNGCEETGTGDVNWYVLEVDIVFDDDANWNYGPALPSGSQVDFETTAVHELGHSIQLAHIIDPGAIMHYAVSPSSANRNPDFNDLAGAAAIFNRSANEPVCGQPVMTASACSLSVESILAESVSIYPNPAKNVLNIKNHNTIELTSIQLFDIQGRSIFNEKLNSQNLINTVNVEKLNTGIFFVEISSNQGIIVKKIIIN